MPNNRTGRSKRDELRQDFDHLKSLIPSFISVDKVAKTQILFRAKHLISTLEKQHKQKQAELMELKVKNKSLKEVLKSLE